MVKSGAIMAATLVAGFALGGCSKPKYDTSSPQAALDAMYQMIADGHPEMLNQMIFIEPRDITYSDGVTEASAIQNVTDKTGEMLGQLYRVAGKLRERFPDDLHRELDQAQTAIRKAADSPRRPDPDFFSRFLTDPFGLMDQQRQRVSVEDLGDGTAAVLIDGKPAFGLGLQMREVAGAWKLDVPIALLKDYRPNTREEWSVIANMMLSLQRALTQFEDELDRGDFRDLQQAGNRAGRLLGERGFVQAIIYQTMKKRPGNGAAMIPDAAAGS